MSTRYSAEVLIAFARGLLEKTGLEADKAGVVADILVEADLLGHTTHGLALLPAYLAQLEKGGMAKSGTPRVIADFPAAVTWDGQRLPGPWVVVQAIETAMERAHRLGTAAVSIRRSHHIACLAAYLRPVTERGFMMVLTCSDPSVSSVAPQGGRTDVFTPNPLAAAWPTDGDPVMLDISMSITTYGLTQRLRAEGRRYPAKWALDANGEPTDDPEVLSAVPPGTLLPIGGVDHGHKGYALALLVEALTGGLAGHGRADPNEGWGATVLVQVYDPACFGGAEDFRRQTAKIVAACHESAPRPGFERVRLPGEAGLRRRAEQLAGGVELYSGIMPALIPWAEKLQVAAPAALT